MILLSLKQVERTHVIRLHGNLRTLSVNVNS